MNKVNVNKVNVNKVKVMNPKKESEWFLCDAGFFRLCVFILFILIAWTTREGIIIFSAERPTMPSPGSHEKIMRNYEDEMDKYENDSSGERKAYFGIGIAIGIIFLIAIIMALFENCPTV